MDKALAMAGYADMAAKKAEAKARGKLLGVGLSTYIEVCGVAPSKWIGAVGEGWGAAMWESANIKVHLTGKIVVTIGTQPQGQGHETTYAQVDRARAGHPDGGHRSSSTRTRRERRSATARTAAGPASVGMTAAIKAAGKIREKARTVRGPHARGERRRHRGRRRQLLRQGQPGPGQDDPGDRLRARPRVRPAGRHGAVPRRDGLPRHAELHVAVRDAHRDRRDRRGDRQGRPRPLRRGRRRRQEDQPDDRGRPAPRRDRPGRRPGALGGRHLRRRRPAPDRARCSTTRCRGPRGSRTSSSTRRSRRRRSTRSGSRASARPAPSPARRPSPTRSSTR